MSLDTIRRYFEAFNRGDPGGMLAELTEDVAHHVNEGEVRFGRVAFADFLAHMSRCYREALSEIVLLGAEDPHRAAAEYVVTGTYLQTDGALPEARGQSYTLAAGSFFTLRGERIARVTTYYNLADWLRQVR